jgi:Domain of unknown function (DUF4149)
MLSMLALRFAAQVAIAVWIGGLLALGAIAAPAIFDVVAARGIADARIVSGAIFGEALRRFHLVAYGCGAAVVLALIARALLGPRPRRFALRLCIASVMLAAALYAGLVLQTRITALQQEIGANVSASSLPQDDPRRVEFGRLHGRSALVQFVPIVGGLLLLFWELND